MSEIPGITSGDARTGAEWTCPFCDRPQILTHPKISEKAVAFNLDSAAEGDLGLKLVALSCANPDCRKTTIGAALKNWVLNARANYELTDATLQIFRLVPRGKELPQPDYIPPAIRKDYREACLILDLSPNASATLARRCLQGVLMDFAKVKKGLLAAQIKELRSMIENREAPPGVTVESADAIDHVREFGNIGAHMEAATGQIVDVAPEEAGLLLELVETLFRDWYVERHNRQRRFRRMNEMSAGKKEEIASARAANSEAKEAGIADDVLPDTDGRDP
jgi:hypothetical protein